LATPPLVSPQAAVFIGYSQSDRQWAQLLASSLQLLGVRITGDEDTSPDLSAWQAEVGSAIMAADVGVLLVSSAALESDSVAFLSDKLSGLRDQGRVVAVLVEQAPWANHPLLGGMSVLPSHGKPLAEFTGPTLDAELASVAHQIADVTFAISGAPRRRPEPTIPIDRWRSLEASPLLHRMVDRAVALAILTDEPTALSSSGLLVALLEAGKYEPQPRPTRCGDRCPSARWLGRLHVLDLSSRAVRRWRS
jgi:hypothetical protein